MKVKIEEIKKLAEDILNKLNVSQEHIEIIINTYLEADLCGVSTHGFNTFPEHIKKFKQGTYPIKPNIQRIKENVCFSLIDSDSAIGPVAANEAMTLAVNKAKESGMYTCFVRNANTFGPAFVYNNIALDNGMIGILFSNSPAQMAPINGTEKLLGTNPIAISIPANKKRPIIYDIATSQVAKSKIKQALMENKEIPADWATDKFGRPTTNPNEAIEGLVLPMAGYKGYGLSMCIDILSGLISGASFLNDVGRFYNNENCMNIGFTAIAINPAIIYDDTFYDKVDSYIEKIINSKTVNDEAKINIPGWNRIEQKEKNIKNNEIELNENTIDELKNLL